MLVSQGSKSVDFQRRNGRNDENLSACETGKAMIGTERNTLTKSDDEERVGGGDARQTLLYS